MNYDQQNTKLLDTKTKVMCTLTIIGICVFVGVPIWWRTTTVYRADLPYEAIADLRIAETSIRINIDVISMSGKISPDTLEEVLSSSLNKNVINEKSAVRLVQGLLIRYKLSSRSASRDEITAFKSSGSLREYDNDIEEENNQLQIVFISASLRKAHDSDIVIGRHQTLYVYVSDEHGFTGDLSTRLTSVLKYVLINEKSLGNTLTTIRDRTIKNPDTMTSVDYSTEYDVVFSLMTSATHSVKWDTRQAIQDYMTPLVDAFSPYADIKVKSQIVYHNELGVHPRKQGETGHYILTADQLPSVINAIEPYLSSHTSVSPTLNLVVYVPSAYNPLIIMDKANQLPSNTFLSARWGALHIVHVNQSEDSAATTVNIDSRRVMATMLSQIRILLGVPDHKFSEGIDIINPGNKVISDWEMKQWVILRCYSNLVSSTATLAALATLLEEITNIVIDSEIGQLVEESLQAIYKTRQYLKSGDIESAFHHSKIAFTSSEAAFFDPSLLQLLYFPEEQKFAIYVPLFLPIAMSFVISLKELIRYLKSGDKKNEDKEGEDKEGEDKKSEDKDTKTD